jgi:RNA 2',3'-cyclic 3'-phosphodiesterase
MTTSWRVFCAVELPDEVRARLQQHIAKLRAEIPYATASWSRVENIHLTLRFFGNVAIDQIPKISAAATRTAEQFERFAIAVGGTGVFPRPSRAQVLWIGVNDASSKLAALQKRLENECAKEGFAKEDRAFRPHLTIARIRKPEGARRLVDAHLQSNFVLTEITVKELILFRSELSPKGSRYTAISRSEFKL